MKIALLVGNQSAGSFVASLSKQLLAAGQRLYVIAEPTTAKQWKLPEALPLWPLPVHRLYLLGSVWKRWRNARRVLSDSDVIHAHDRRAAILAMLMTVFMKRQPPLVVSLYERAEENRDTWLQRLVLWWMGKRASLISASSVRLTEKIDRSVSVADATVSMLVSPQVERLVQTELLNRKERIENWGRLAAAERLRNRGQLVLAVGNVQAEKRYDRFVAAMDAVTYPCTAVVIGDGDPGLLAALRSQGEHSQVSFLGSRSNISEWLRAAAVLVVTSEWESRAFVTQEAMAVGLPVVAAPVGRLRDLMLPQGTTQLPRQVASDEVRVFSPAAAGGLLVNPENPAETAAAITTLLANPGVWYEKQDAARSRALTWPTNKQIAADWIEIYQSYANPAAPGK